MTLEASLFSALELPSSDNFPANAETLYHALIQAGEHGRILGKASLAALYSSTQEPRTPIDSGLSVRDSVALAAVCV